MSRALRTQNRHRPVVLRWIMLGVMAAGLWLSAQSSAQMGLDVQTIRGFEVPEFDRDNRLRSKLFGDFARLLPSGLVDITNMRIEFFDGAREVEMRVTAETCVYDRNTRNAESETRVRIARENMIITGEGFTWSAENGVFEIHDDAKVVLRGALRRLEVPVE